MNNEKTGRTVGVVLEHKLKMMTHESRQSQHNIRAIKVIITIVDVKVTNKRSSTTQP
jgi:hypothetical protein